MKNKSKLTGKGKTINRMLALVLALFFAFNSFDADVLAYEDGNEQDITIETDTTKEADTSSDEEKNDTTDDEIVESEEDDEESDKEDVKSGEGDAKSEEERKAASKAADDIDNSVEEPVDPEEIENKGEGEAETEFPEFSYQESVDGYTISIDAPEGVFPEGTTTKISVVNDPISLIEGEVDEERDIQYIITFDISFWHDGTEIEPQNEKVNVSISLTPEIKENLLDDTAQLQVFHIENETDIEEIAATTNDEEICFEADSFSPYSFVVTTAANTPNKYYTVYFWNNGVDYVYGSMGSIRCEFGKEYQLPKSTLTQDVYKFIGWNTMPDGTGTYYGDEAMIIDLTTVDYGFVNLYAQWEVDYSNCPHSGRLGGDRVEINNVVTKEASSTEWGEVQKKCSFCGAVVETISVHPYDTYEIALQDGTVQKVYGWFDSDYSREVYEQVNEYRLENGLNTLVYNSSLEYASNLRALECSVYFQHTRPNGTRWNTVTSGWSSGGENIAAGYKTPSEVMNGWKSSPGHNANMLHGINSGETSWEGLSVGCFHAMTFHDNIPFERLSWSQHFTDYNAEQENTDEVRVIEQPKNINANSGQSITLSLSATGSDLSYKWEFKAKDSNAWVTVGSGNPCNLIAGADVSTGVYRCSIKFTSRLSEYVYSTSYVYSEMAQINVLSGTEITKHPQDVNTKADSAANFSITAKGEQLSYQWQYRMSDSSDWKNISGGTSNSVQVTIPASWNGAHVRCVVTDKKGVKLNSRAATIKVTDAVNTEPQGTSSTSGETSGDLVEDFVSRMYTVALGRPYDEAGLNDWVNQLKAGTRDGAGIAQGFIESAEFTGKNYTNEQYLDILYHTFFDRDPDAGGYENWLNQMNSGASRRHVLAGFVNSQEFTGLCDRYGIIRGTLADDAQGASNQDTNVQVRAFVERMYGKALGRQGEEEGINSWTQRIVSGEWAAAEVAKQGFFNSAEYAGKNRSNEEFVEDLYQALFDRPADEAGKADWLSRLAGGASREEIMNGFGGSPEFANMLAGFGLN